MLGLGRLDRWYTHQETVWRLDMLNQRCLWDIQGKTWAWARDRALKPGVAFEGLQMDEVAQG